MSAVGSTIARILIALALIVQIWAPVGSSVAMVTATTDPFVDIIVCAQDQAALDRQDRPDPLLRHHGDACQLCQFVAGAGFAPPPETPTLQTVDLAQEVADWAIRVEIPVAVRLLDHIRGRAPPLFS